MPNISQSQRSGSQLAAYWLHTRNVAPLSDPCKSPDLRRLDQKHFQTLVQILFSAAPALAAGFPGWRCPRVGLGLSETSPYMFLGWFAPLNTKLAGTPLAYAVRLPINGRGIVYRGSCKPDWDPSGSDSHSGWTTLAKGSDLMPTPSKVYPPIPGSPKLIVEGKASSQWPQLPQPRRSWSRWG